MTSREDKHELFGRKTTWEVKFKEHKDVTTTGPGTYESRVPVTVVLDKGEWPVKPGDQIRFDDPDELQAGVIPIAWDRVLSHK